MRGVERREREVCFDDGIQNFPLAAAGMTQQNNLTETDAIITTPYTTVTIGEVISSNPSHLERLVHDLLELGDGSAIAGTPDVL